MPTIPLSQNRLKFALDLFLPKQVSEHGKKLLPYIKQPDKGFYLTSKQPDKGFLYVLVLFHAKDLIVAFI